MSINEFKNLKLLYVEDEKNVRKYASSYFKRIFGEVHESANASTAFEIFKKEKPHILITDIKMEELSGIELIKQIRHIDKNCQIIILSAFLDTQYLLDAIPLNIVKYLSKPINHDELYGVLLQCLKNISENHNTLIHFSKSSYYNVSKRILFNDGHIIKLSHQEIKFLELLCENKTRVVPYEEIENAIWYDTVMSENALRTLVKKLRQKLPKNSLENISKLGYKIQCL